MHESSKKHLFRYNGVGLIIVATLFLAILSAVFACRRNQAPGESTESDRASGRTKMIDGDIASLEHAWAANPSHAPIALSLAALHSGRGQHATAAEYYAEVIPLLSVPLKHDAMVNLSKELATSGRTDAARTEMVRLLHEAPDHPAGLFNLGAIEANSGNADEAHRLWSRLVEVHPDDSLAVKARLNLAKLTRQLTENAHASD